MLAPTTVGSGPFKPAIMFEETLWVLDVEFENEEKAYQRAHEMYTLACKEFTDKLKRQCWAPRAHK